jgi:hypothetical protein
MKKLSKLLPVIAFLSYLSFFTTQANAQETLYNWKDYGVSFSVPKTHAIKNNTSSTFESGDNLTWLEMYPYKDGSATAKGMVYEVAKKQSSINIVDEGAYTSGGYDGYWLTCETDAYPEWRFWYIGFIDPASDVNFYAKIWFKKNDPIAKSIANKMSYSFKKMK